jgi:hypothetical protein
MFNLILGLSFILGILLWVFSFVKVIRNLILFLWQRKYSKSHLIDYVLKIAVIYLLFFPIVLAIINFPDDISAYSLSFFTIGFMPLLGFISTLYYSFYFILKYLKNKSNELLLAFGVVLITAFLSILYYVISHKTFIYPIGC